METPPIRVLLIEDNPADARLIELMLGEARGLRFELLWADDLNAGVEQLREHSADVVLLDLGLPESTGLDTLHRLQALGVKLPTLVVLSGLTDEEIAVQALQLGAQDYLVKGQVDASLLIRAIRYAMGRSQAEEALRQAHAEAQAAQQRAEIANEAKSAFLANMSHDLRTPLNGILGFAQILQWDRSLSERQQLGITAIRQSGEHLLTLINDILDVAKIEAGKIEMFPSDFALDKFLQVIASIIRVKAEQKPELKFTCDLAADLPEAIRADERRLRQVLLNLLDNAVKFTDRGQVVLRVRFSAPSRLRFEVEDTGIGMSEEQVSRLFQPFEQLGEPHRRSGGTGLGLVISRQFVRLMGGDIHVKSRLHAGNLFWFEIDVPVIRCPAPDQPLAERVVVGYRGPQKKVLVVDDVAENRAVLVEALDRLGFDVAQAAGGYDGLAQAQAMQPDLVLVDIVMPDIGGLEVIQRLRTFPALHATPIVAVSASATPDVESKTMAAGANAFLPKPVDVKSLLSCAGSLLNLSWVEAAGRKFAA
ncbi:response regulator [Piscinibacter sp. XHJ-5]|uniref:response regulator n=1 Tax=Piscinibacter sp. XHJ-5 TaxID=3037797 RepID=UPI002452DFF3|nr:response regulator [Piscinibacter sp. XHJ-5]